MEIYFGQEVTYFQDMSVVNRIINEIILERLTFEIMISNNIGYEVIFGN